MPPVLHEENLRCFKFLFKGDLHDGLSYRGELFYRLSSATAENRVQFFQHACKLARWETLVITASDRSSYSLWISLRSPRARLYITEKISAFPLPTVSSPAIIEIVAERTAEAVPLTSLKPQSSQ